MGDMMSRNELVKSGLKGTGGVLGGIGLLVLAGFSGSFIPGLVFGGLLTVTGLALANSKSDRLAGFVSLGAGALTLLASFNIPLLSGLAGGFLRLGGFGLLIAGGISLYRYFKGLKSRS